MKTTTLRPAPAHKAGEVLRECNRRCAAVDGVPPFSDHTKRQLGSDRLSRFYEYVLSGPEPVPLGGAAVTLASSGDCQAEVELAVFPEMRGQGYGRRLVDLILRQLQEEISSAKLCFWAHGSLPAALSLAKSFRAVTIRKLLIMKADLYQGPLLSARSQKQQSEATGAVLRAFQPGPVGADAPASAEESRWLEVNSRVFSFHPEQGRQTLHDLRQLYSEHWFSAENFLLAVEHPEDNPDNLLGYVILKTFKQNTMPGNSVGEFHVLGVASPGRGLGSLLMRAGAERLRKLGCRWGLLYVEANNNAAVALYRKMGFQVTSSDRLLRIEENT